MGRKAQMSNDRWEEQKRVITQLYITEGRLLKEVIDIMANKHSFHATTKMYKQRLAHWKLYKNHRAEDIHTDTPQYYDITRHRDPRADLDLQHKPWEYGSLKDYLVRRARRIKGLTSRGKMTTAESGNVRWAPVVTAANTYQPKPPHDQAVPESLLMAINEYFRGGLRSGLWAPDPNDPWQIVGVKPGGADLRTLYLFTRLYRLACLHVEKGSFVEAREVLSQAFECAQDCIKAEHPRFLGCFWDTVFRLSCHGRPELVDMLIRYSVSYAKIHFAAHPQYPIWRIFQSLSMLTGEKRRQAIEVAWRCTVDCINQLYGSYAALALASKAQLERMYQPELREKVDTQLLVVEEMHAPHPFIDQAQAKWRKLLQIDEDSTSSPSRTNLASPQVQHRRSQHVEGASPLQSWVNIAARFPHTTALSTSHPGFKQTPRDAAADACSGRVRALIDGVMRLAANYISSDMRQAAESQVRFAIWMWVRQWGSYNACTIDFVTRVQRWLQQLDLGYHELLQDVAWLLSAALATSPLKGSGNA